MRILHVVEAFGGGMFEIVRAISDRHARAGHDVGIAYGRRPETPDLVEGLLDPRVGLHPTPWTQRTLASQLRCIGAFRRIAHETQPDVVHLHSTFAGVMGSLMLRGRAPLIYTPQGYSFSRGGSRVTRGTYRAIERIVAHRVDLIGACSHSEAELAGQLTDPRRVVVVANGIPELDEEPAAREPSPARHRVVGLGRLVAQRDPAGAARVLARVADIADVAWVGGGPDDAELRATGVRITGWLPHDEGMRQLEHSTAYLHWTAWDGLPLSIMEAMARDVVVIARDIGPNRELLGPDQVCSTEEDAAELLRAVLTDAALRRRLLASQRERRRGFSADRMADEWLALYERISAHREPRVLDGVVAGPA